MALDKFIAVQVIDIEGRTYTFDDLTGVDDTRLNEAYKTNPARLTYFGARAAVAEAIHADMENTTKRVYSDLELEYRESLPEQGIKVTEPMLKAYVLGDKRYIEAQKNESEALRNFKLMRAIVDGLRDRSQMLISLGAQVRMEYELQDLALLATKDKLKARAADRRSRDGAE